MYLIRTKRRLRTSYSNCLIAWMHIMHMMDSDILFFTQALTHSSFQSLLQKRKRALLSQFLQPSNPNQVNFDFFFFSFLASSHLCSQAQANPVKPDQFLNHRRSKSYIITNNFLKLRQTYLSANIHQFLKHFTVDEMLFENV